jgi:hypothetical protein
MQWLLGDEDVWSGELEYPLKRAITFDPIVGSRPNFYKGFQRLFSLGKLWNRCSVTRMSSRQSWVSAQKGHNFWSDRRIALKCLQGFPEAVFLRVTMEWLVGDEDVWSPILEYGLKSAITFDPTVGSHLNFYRGFQRQFLLGWIWNGYSVMRMSCRSKLSFGLKRL